MTLKEFIIHWNNSHKYDYWWRSKYNVAFNSEAHRKTNQYDIAFEYLEDKIMKNEIQQRDEMERKKQAFKKTRQWIVEREEDKEKGDRLLENIKISDFND